MELSVDDGDFIPVVAESILILLRGSMPFTPTRVMINDKEIVPQPLDDFYLLPDVLSPIPLDASNAFDRLEFKVTGGVQNVLIDVHPDATVSKVWINA